MQVAIISASPRANSGSLKTAEAIAHQITKQGHSVQIVPMDQSDIPMVGRGSINPEQLTAFQSQLIEAWAKSQLVIFTIPEYNWSTSGEFINMMHQLGNKHFAHQLFHHKTFALAGVSSGRGGRIPALDANMLISKVISFTNHYSIVSPKIFEAHEVQKNLGEHGISLGNEIFDQALADFARYSLHISQLWVSSTTATTTHHVGV